MVDHRDDRVAKRGPVATTDGHVAAKGSHPSAHGGNTLERIAF